MAKKQKAAEAEILTECGCGSTRRSEYDERTYYRDYSGAGLEFEGIWYRPTACLDCGQHRVDQEKVFAAKAAG